MTCRAVAHTLVLFDIDGTLIHTGGAGGRAMTRAFRESYAIENGFDGIPLPGRTDVMILADAFARACIAADADVVAGFRRVYLRCLSDELRNLSPHVRGILPGVTSLLTRLVACPTVTVGLLTGNYSDTARLKLERFALWAFFALGAFAEDAADRNSLVDVARARAGALGIPILEPRQIVVVGDTPLDVACGRTNGARTLAVATGSFGADALRAAGADLVLDDLSQDEDVMAWVVSGQSGLESSNA
jgi:phosphoglycolate phosphatase-like HAD superfamily hydrolase